MLTFEKFTGINNVLPQHRIKESELTQAENVDVGSDNELRRRKGYSIKQNLCHENLHQASGFMLATVLGDLCKSDGVAQTVLYPSLGNDRVWYCNLPDGRTTFSNGLINGITDGNTATQWGVPLPPGVGALTPVSGELFPGEYQYAITYVRLSDGLEGGPAYSGPCHVQDGGVLLTGLPIEPGYRINVYLSGHNGGTMYLAGTTLTSSFSYLGKNSSLTLPLTTDFLGPMPVGTVTAFWRGRLLVAGGSVLWASKTHQVELCDRRKDFKQFTAPITLIQPVDGGIFVGTTAELVFLAGQQWDQLAMVKKMDGPVVLGSGVKAPGDRVGGGAWDSMLCIANGEIVAGYYDGTVKGLAENRYKTEVTEVTATFRDVDGIPQYIAVPR